MRAGKFTRCRKLSPLTDWKSPPNRGIAGIVKCAMTLLKRSLLVVLAAALAADAAYAQNALDLKRLVDALEIRPGSAVGEIGAGGGELTLAMARTVGEKGKVFSNEIYTGRARAIEQAVEKANLKHVTVVEGHAMRTNFPAQCCDAIFMRNVYHHFGDPRAMNASLRESLKPGGRLAIIDFTPPPGGEAAPGKRGEDGHHGITASTLEAELKAAGFEILSAATDDRSAFVVARKPS
jgi:ubiquinone/menaquinone biosynthesis C-methylase UbiE